MRLFPYAFGSSLALISQTGSRSDAGVGLGELGLIVCVALGVGRSLHSRVFVFSGVEQRFAGIFLVYTLLPLFAITTISTLGGVVGASMRDLAAYLLSALMLFFLAKSKVDRLAITQTFLVVFGLVVAYRLGTSPVEGGRFAGGATNPNQLALYVCCAICLVPAAIKSNAWRLLVIGIFSIVGVLSGSDAFEAAAVAFFITFVSIKIIPAKSFVPWGVLLLGALAVLCIYLLPTIASFLFDSWDTADEGGSRVSLYVHGLNAWSSSLFSIFLGNGAGSYSGLTGEFQGAEAHNTPIDILAMGGLLGLFVLYWFPIRCAFVAYKSRMPGICALVISLLVFSLFHFVARHPVFWFSVYMLIVFVEYPDGGWK